MLSIVGCVPAVRAGLPPRPAAVDSVWYISTRARVAGADSRTLADSLEYGVAIFQRSATDGQSADAELTLADSIVLSAETFVGLLRRRLAGQTVPDNFAVLYVHGFGTSLHEAWQYTAQAQQLTGSRAPWIAFCWPSNGLGVNWPRPGQLLFRAYREDSVAAQASRPAFVTAATALVDALDSNQVVLAIHSLGAQLAGESLATDSVLRAALHQRPLRALAFLVPDIETTHFLDDLLPTYAMLTPRRVLYVASNDRALALARSASGTTRIGLRSVPMLTHPLLETVDITDGLTTEGWFQRLFGTHHAIRRKIGMLVDLAQVVGGGYAATCRTVLGTGTWHDDGTWSLRRVPVPSPAARQACARFVPEVRP